MSRHSEMPLPYRVKRNGEEAKAARLNGFTTKIAREEAEDLLRMMTMDLLQGQPEVAGLRQDVEAVLAVPVVG